MKLPEISADRDDNVVQAKANKLLYFSVNSDETALLKIEGFCTIYLERFQITVC